MTSTTEPFFECSDSSRSGDDFLKGKVYFNDLILRNIIKYIPNKDRKNLELTCRHLYNLSTETPCYTGKELYLTVHPANIRHLDAFTIFLEEKDPETRKYKYIPGTKSLCIYSDLCSLLKVYSRRFREEIKRISIVETLHAEHLETINYFFKYTLQLYCKGFQKDALEYLKSDEQTLSKRVVKLGIYGFNLNNSDMFVHFKNLKQIYYEPNKGKSDCEKLTLDTSFEYFYKEVDKLETKVDTIYVRNENFESNQLSQRCNYLKYSNFNNPTLWNVRSLLNTVNLAVLELTFRRFPYFDVISFFSGVNIYRLKRVYLAYMKYDSKILKLFTPPEKENSSLTALTIRECERLPDCISSLANIFPPSLKKLELHTELNKNDLEIIAEKCPYLEDFDYFPTIIQLDVKVKQCSKLFHEMLFKLKELKRFVTNLPLGVNFLMDLCKSATKISEAMFTLYGADDTKVNTIFKDVKKPPEESTKALPIESDHVEEGSPRLTCCFYDLSLYLPLSSKIVKKLSLLSMSCSIISCPCKN